MSRSVMMSDLSCPEYKRRIEEEDAIILLPVRAVEQRGYHLPLGTDWIMATEMCRRVRRRDRRSAGHVRLQVADPFGRRQPLPRHYPVFRNSAPKRV